MYNRNQKHFFYMSAFVIGNGSYFQLKIHHLGMGMRIFPFNATTKVKSTSNCSTFRN